MIGVARSVRYAIRVRGRNGLTAPAGTDGRSLLLCYPRPDEYPEYRITGLIGPFSMWADPADAMAVLLALTEDGDAEVVSLVVDGECLCGVVADGAGRGLELGGINPGELAKRCECGVRYDFGDLLGGHD